MADIGAAETAAVVEDEMEILCFGSGWEPKPVTNGIRLMESGISGDDVFFKTKDADRCLQNSRI